ncbi:hypothetical protein QVD17_31682 [Tagetes erecta]|uniref:Uncharacterized protein n=1 Tax=Tagetes erecta TaxID=13708 RepID=A0AAD8NNR2_TARER|nr:hypothetical protein QVD17_31682 [Tagetes erecta]
MYLLYRDEEKCIKDIVDTISNRLFELDTKVKSDFIGTETRLKDLKTKLEIGSGGVHMVGIWGVGGNGKTTLASAAYIEMSHKFEAHCLLQNIRVESNKHGLEKLQEKFLSLVLKTNVLETEVLNLESYNGDPRLPDVVANMKKLRSITWGWYPTSSFPSNFKPTHLGYLELYRGQQKQLWEGCKRLPNLKILDISHSYYLTTTPDFEGLPCLERLYLSCHKLKGIEANLGLLKNLKDLNLDCCELLIQHSTSFIRNLELQSFSRKSSVSWKFPQFPCFIRKMSLSGCNLRDGDIPFEISELLNLEILDLSHNQFSRHPFANSMSQVPGFVGLQKPYRIAGSPLKNSYSQSN